MRNSSILGERRRIVASLGTRSNALALFFAGWVFLIVTAAVFAQNVAPYPPEATHIDSLNQPPSQQFILGTDHFGRDLFSRVVHGARLSLTVSVLSTAIAVLVGATIGLNAAFFGGRLETILMRIVDGMLSFPPILVAIFVIVLLGSSTPNLIFTIGVLYVPHLARVARSATLNVKHSEYVEAARAVGLSTRRIVLKTVLPNILSPVLVQAALMMGSAIIIESGLSFLGLGPPPPASSWGRMIQQSSRFIQTNPYAILWPSLVLSITVLAFNILGGSITEHFDPRRRSR